MYILYEVYYYCRDLAGSLYAPVILASPVLQSREREREREREMVGVKKGVV